VTLKSIDGNKKAKSIQAASCLKGLSELEKKYVKIKSAFLMHKKVIEEGNCELNEPNYKIYLNGRDKLIKALSSLKIDEYSKIVSKDEELRVFLKKNSRILVGAGLRKKKKPRPSKKMSAEEKLRKRIKRSIPVEQKNKLHALAVGLQRPFIDIFGECLANGIEIFMKKASESASENAKKDQAKEPEQHAE
jgi:hypothetical protein